LPLPAPGDFFERIVGRVVEQLATWAQPADVVVERVFDERSGRGRAPPGGIPADALEVIGQLRDPRMLCECQTALRRLLEFWRRTQGENPVRNVVGPHLNADDAASRES
jgi:hypothetical protein